MFFIHIMGRRSSHKTANTLEELGDAVTKAIKSQANDCVVVAIGKTDQAVMPYVWIRRNVDTDEWEGELGDCIKLGIKDGLLVEKDPIQMLSLDQAVERGLATIEDEGELRTVIMHDEPQPRPKQKKLTNEEKVIEAKRMIDDLFATLREEDYDESDD